MAQNTLLQTIRNERVRGKEGWEVIYLTFKSTSLHNVQTCILPDCLVSDKCLNICRSGLVSSISEILRKQKLGRLDSSMIYHLGVKLVVMNFTKNRHLVFALWSNRIEYKDNVLYLQSTLHPWGSNFTNISSLIFAKNLKGRG